MHRLRNLARNCVQFGAIRSMAVISYVKYLQDLRTTVIKISSFFISLKKNERVYRIFLYHAVLSKPYFM